MRRLREADIAGLIVIGGNGSQLGALALAAHGFPVVGIASTIDNDLAGTDISIGATTALETAVGCIDRLRVTASSHRRAFLVEVMGRHSGYLALQAGIASGAEAIVIPEVETSVSTLAEALLAAEQRGKKHAIVVVAEGARLNAEAIAAAFSEQHAALGFELRISKLGHIQRGGAPCVFDRLIATQLGTAAIERYLEGERAALIGIVSGQVSCAPLSIARDEKRLDLSLLQVADIMAR